MDLHEMTRTQSFKRIVDADTDNLVSLPAWQAARDRLDHYLALLDVPAHLRQQWAGVAFARALRQRSAEPPVRIAMLELQRLLGEHRLHASAAASSRRACISQRTPLRPASLEADLSQRIGRWFRRRIGQWWSRSA